MQAMQAKKKVKFKSLKEKVSQGTLTGIKEMGFKLMTDIQCEVLPLALEENDIVATAKTGSGKTLAFLVPAIEVAIKNQLQDLQGTCSIIISPTRELAMQSYRVLQELLTHNDGITSTLIIGGESKKKQSAELSRGVHIVVATPGRLFDHMRTAEFDYSRVTCLILDEADKIFQYGFEEDLKQIIKRLPKNRQTMLFSATQSDRTEALIQSAMKENVTIVNTDEDDVKATVDGLKQGYVICETEYRLWWLHKMLKKAQNQKVMVFFSSCKSVEYHYELFRTYFQAPVICIHGKMSQCDRSAVMSEFYSGQQVALLCTDLAARGLDVPAVDWVVQYDPPADTNEYIHRVGRTARGSGAVGKAVLLLRPEEADFVDYLKDAKIYLDKYEMWDKLGNLQTKLEAALSNPEVRQLAVAAFEGYLRAMEVRKLKHVFNVVAMDMGAVAKSFGLKEIPDVDIHIGFSKKHRPRKRQATLLASKVEGIKCAKT